MSARRHFSFLFAALFSHVCSGLGFGDVSYLLVQGPFGIANAVETFKWQVNYSPGQLVTGQDLLNAVFGSPTASGQYTTTGAYPDTYNYLTSSSEHLLGAGYLNFYGSLLLESLTVDGNKVAQTTNFSSSWSYYYDPSGPVTTQTNPPNGNWYYAEVGQGSRQLTNGSFDGWVFGLNGGPPDYSAPLIEGVVNLPQASNFPAATWAANNGLSPGNSLPGADPDGDGKINLLEFATDDNPNNPGASGRMVTKFWTIGGQHVFTLTMPVRTGAIFSGAGDQVSAAIDGVIYEIQGTDDLVAGFTSSVAVSEVTGTDATNIQAGLPMLDSGWTYRTFRKSASAVSSPASFLRLKVTSSS